MFFSKKEPEHVYIKGKQLECPVCSNKFFDKKKTRIQVLFGWVISANSYICTECNYIYWFKHKPE